MTTLLIVEILGSSDVGEDQYATVHLALDLPVVPQIGSSLRLQYVEKPEQVDQAFGMADLAGVHPSALFLIEEIIFVVEDNSIEITSYLGVDSGERVPHVVRMLDLAFGFVEFLI